MVADAPLPAAATGSFACKGAADRLQALVSAKSTDQAASGRMNVETLSESMARRLIARRALHFDSSRAAAFYEPPKRTLG
ncbi:MAG TPA: hypothetical protein VFN67_22095 [Polyangiales bacterium]|nr:hypothetical protein [Polyangiales bacterium]